MKYRVVSSSEVDDYLKNGWILYGNPMAITAHSIKQAIIKDTDNAEEAGGDTQSGPEVR